MAARRAVAFVAIAWLAATHAAAETTRVETRFESPQRAEAVARITAVCEACAWDVEGREAVVLSLFLDGRYSQHLPLVRAGRAEYAVFLGPVAPGVHTLRIDVDPGLTARDLRAGRAAIVEAIDVDQFDTSHPEYVALSFAPFVYARPNTIGRFTDVPAFMWYEIEPTPRGRRYRYSVVFTNEDGGTPADRLMATWGRTTDIEYLYSVELDAAGAILSDDMQGPKHEILPFGGRREGGHPLLWVVTDNNMVLDEGTTEVRYAPAPVAFPLEGVSREAVMDANPWLYVVMAQELAREGKIVADAAPGQGTVPDPRRFVYIEGCAEVGGAALAFAVRAGDEWFPSDRGIREYRIVRDGCFRAAIPLSAGLSESDVTDVRVQAFERPAAAGQEPAPPGPVRFHRINELFMLDDGFHPRPSRFRWEGPALIAPGGAPLDLALPGTS